ncbi:trimeric intracellular cation channel family protein [Streptomyces sp. NPDC051636]|uniref:trimeric intracellular cation channel family protein n=1 Tax=Streptomyces sp. NPDC051636 TaxID=3365663 RepID=UPI0037A23209
MHELTSPASQYFLDLLGIFGFALSGAYLGVRKDFNLFGTLVLAEAAGLGGGLLRDLVLDVPSIAFTDFGYPVAPLAAALIAYRGRPLRQQPYLFDVLDAVGLGLFSVTGTVKGLLHGMDALPSAALGVITAMGGGILASSVAKELPALLRWDSDLYAVPSLVGAGATAALHAAGLLDVVTATTAALAAFTLRLLALHFRWRPRRSTTWRGHPSPPSRHTAPDLPSTPSEYGEFPDTMRLRVIRPAQNRTVPKHRLTRSAATSVAPPPRPVRTSVPGPVDPRLSMAIRHSPNRQSQQSGSGELPPRKGA